MEGIIAVGTADKPNKNRTDSAARDVPAAAPEYLLSMAGSTCDFIDDICETRSLM